MKRTRRALGGLLVALVVVGWVTSAMGQSINCGDTLGPGGHFLLQADLHCDSVAVALTLRDGALLDLGGYTVSAGETAVILAGRGTVLKNGFATGGALTSVSIEGEGWHLVSEVQGSGLSDGFIISSDHNRIIGNIGAGLGVGFRIQGHHNLLSRNVGEGQGGFEVLGNANLLLHNSSIPGMHDGIVLSGDANLLVGHTVRECERAITVSGDRNLVVGNIVMRNDEGIRVGGSQNVIVRNTAVENGIDLTDLQQDCGNNLWRQNVFHTSLAGDTMNPSCIQ